MTRRFLLALAIASSLAAIGFAGSGCSTRDPADSNIPWGRPAAWEDRVPGFDY